MIITQPRHINDCTGACIASILEFPIEKLPAFWEDSLKKQSAVKQYEDIREWLAERGWHFYYSQCSAKQFANFQKGKWKIGDSWPPRGYWIGEIARVDWIIDNEPKHVVVMEGFKCLYNPGGTVKETKEDDVFLVGYYLLTPIDPAKMVQRD